MEKFIVSRDDSIYEAWPDVVLTPTGRLICVFTECEHHGNRDNSRLVYVISDDRGRTWSKKHFLTEQGKRNAYYNNARLSLLSDGRIAVVADFDENEKNVSAMHVRLWFSSDNGESFTEPVEVPIHGIVPDKLLELQSGRWVIAAHHYSDITDKLTEYCIYSDDKGKMWSDVITLASDERYHLCEASMVEVEPNVIVAFMRENSAQGYDCFKAISYNGGESWNGVFHVPLPGCHRPTAGFLQDGSMLITYRFMQGGKGWLGNWCQNVFGAWLPRESVLAEKRGEQSARIFPIDFDRSRVSDLGYTGWVQFPDGEIYVVNYIVDDAPKAQIRGYSFRITDFLLV